MSGREIDHLPHHFAEIKNNWRHVTNPPYMNLLHVYGQFYVTVLSQYSEPTTHASGETSDYYAKNIYNRLLKEN